MGEFTQSTQPAEDYVSSAWAYNEFGKVATALDATYDYYAVPFYVASVGNSAANTTIQDTVHFPEAGTIESCTLRCTTQTGTSDPTVDVFDENAGTPATVLTGVVTLAAAKTAYTATFDTGNDTVAANDSYGIRCVTAADGTITQLAGTFLFKKLSAA